nr:hypothetical protein L204_05946 [Cryptococcus depauperatus CBS 7855]
MIQPAPKITKQEKAKEDLLNDSKEKGKAYKSKKQEATLPTIPNKDLFHRINFSYQAAVFLQNLGSSYKPLSQTVGQEVSTIVNKKGKKRAFEYESGPKQDEDQGARFRKLARLAMRQCRVMVAHNQIKLDPNMKRSICKTCGTILVPGTTARIRNRCKFLLLPTIHQSQTTCLSCATTFSIPTSPNATLSCDSLRPDEALWTKKGRKIVQNSKIPFHEKEVIDDAVYKDKEQEREGHTLWRGEEKIRGWGVCLANDNDKELNVTTEDAQVDDVLFE